MHFAFLLKYYHFLNLKFYWKGEEQSFLEMCVTILFETWKLDFQIGPPNNNRAKTTVLVLIYR